MRAVQTEKTPAGPSLLDGSRCRTHGVANAVGRPRDAADDEWIRDKSESCEDFVLTSRQSQRYKET